MATQAHCAFCFETLSSTLTKTPSLTLTEVVTLWKQWNNGNPLTDDDDPDPEPSDSEPEAPANPAISRLAAPSPATSSSSSLPSVASTPSRASEASSATSKSSSRSSFFGLGKSKLKSDEEPAELEEHPLFVTWNTVHRNGEKRLRGCIGTFEKLELEEGLASYALTSCVPVFSFSPLSPVQNTPMGS
jgi:hypothetical protein